MASNIGRSTYEILDTKGQAELWPRLFAGLTTQESTVSTQQSSAQAYFRYVYRNEHQKLHRGIGKYLLQRQNHGLSHQNVADLAAFVWSHSRLPKSELVDSLRHEAESLLPLLTSEQWQQTLDLVVRLAFFVNARDDYGEGKEGIAATPCTWRMDQNIRQFVSEALPGSKWTPQGRESLLRLKTGFTVPNMVSICGLRLHYTSSLQDHLKLTFVDGHKTLQVFPYKSCLVALVQAKE